MKKFIFSIIVLTLSVSYAICQEYDIKSLEYGLDSLSGNSKIESLLKISEHYQKNQDTAKLNIYLQQLVKEFKKQYNVDFSQKNLSKVTANNSNSILIIIPTVLLIVVLIWLFVLFKKIKKQNITVFEQNLQIEFQSNEILRIKSQISDSISYARKIQDSILVPEEEIKRYLPEMFIYYQPREIVSGDFYWFSKVEFKYVIAAIDCTGHGVPGAFLSMIGNTLLNEIVNDRGITKPDEILTLLHIGVLKALKQNREDAINEDGMDLSLCTIDVRQKRFQFAGAKNHLYVIQGDQLKVLKANFLSIGGRPLRPEVDENVKFTAYDFMYDDKTSIYMLSDGYLDQFGGLEDTKFNANRFKQMLLENRNLPMNEQKVILQNALEEWKGDKKQVDDILVLGVKLSEKL